MDKETILASARLLQSISSDIVNEYIAKREDILSKMNSTISVREDILDLIGGEGNLATMENNHANHVQFMASVWSMYDPDTFVEIIAWVYRTYRARGFKPEYWIVQLNLWLDILHTSLTEKSYAAIRPFYEFILNYHSFFVRSTNVVKEGKMQSISKEPTSDNTRVSILVIDDDRQVHDIFALRLKKDGYQLDCVFSGEEAVSLVKLKKFDVIFVDIIMPGMDGVETCKAIKKIRPDAILVSMTGNFGKDTILKESQFVSAGGRTYYLYKPFADNELRDVIQKALKEK